MSSGTSFSFVFLSLIKPLLNSGPRLSLSNQTYNLAKPDIIIMAITSQVHVPAKLGEVEIKQWQSANLLKPSLVKPVLATVEQTLILRKLGVLAPPGQAALRQAIVSLLS
jgi:mRNA interferase MazF